MRHLLCAALVLLVLRSQLPAAEESKEPKGTLDQVTVYRGQALVTRLVDLPGKAGLQEVVITGLPEQVLPGSIYAESADGVEVRSVRYRVRPVMQDVREEVRKLDTTLRQTQDDIEANNTQLRVLAERKEYLSKLEQFTAPTATVEMTKGVLNAETLKALTEFTFSQRAEIATAEYELALAQRERNEKLSLLQRERDVLTGGSAKTVREAVVFVNLKEAGGKLRLRYLVDGANWSPSYNVRTDADRKQVTVEYNASIEQMSGEDWSNVEMTLSTATPSLVAKAPLLEPLAIALGYPSTGKNQQANRPASGPGYLAAKKEIDERRKQFERSRGQQAANIANQPAAQQLEEQGEQFFEQLQEQAKQVDWNLNSLANESQVLDLINRDRIEKASKAFGSAFTEGVSVSYQLADRTSLPSRADRQLIQIASLPMKAEFYKVAIPVLTSHVYDEARVTNASKMVMLAGPVSAYQAGQFVGRGDVPTVSIGESFTIGFGIDSALRATRELAKKTESIQGGNRVVDFTYQLAIENFGSEPAKVRLMDRLPTAKENEVKLTLASSSAELSKDETYQQSERKKGLLRWEVEVPAQAIGPKAFTLDYQLQMEYDKQLEITGLPVQKR